MLGVWPSRHLSINKRLNLKSTGTQGPSSVELFVAGNSRLHQTHSAHGALPPLLPSAAQGRHKKHSEKPNIGKDISWTSKIKPWPTSCYLLPGNKKVSIPDDSGVNKTNEGWEGENPNQQGDAWRGQIQDFHPLKSCQNPAAQGKAFWVSPTPK